MIGIRQTPGKETFELSCTSYYGKRCRRFGFLTADAADEEKRKLKTKPDGQGMTVAQVAPLYLKKVEENDRPKSYATARSNLDVHILPFFGNRRLLDLDSTDGPAFRDKLAETLGPGTVQRVWQTWMALVNYAIDPLFIPNLVNKMHKTKMPFAPPRTGYLDNEALAGLRPCCPPLLWQSIVVMCGMGLRPGKAMELEAAGLRYEKETGLARGPWGDVPAAVCEKKGNPTEIPLSDRVLEVYRGKTGKLLPWKREGEMREAFHQACVGAGHVKRDKHGELVLNNGKIITLFQPRDCRRTFRTRLEGLGLSKNEVAYKHLMGHRFVGMDNVYVVLNADRRAHLRDLVTRVARTYDDFPALSLVAEV